MMGMMGIMGVDGNGWEMMAMRTIRKEWDGWERQH